MEIASPCCELPDPFGQNRNKRSYSCAQFSDSTGGVTSVPINHTESSHVDNVFHSLPFYGTASKKRRMNTNEELDVKHTSSPFVNFSPSSSVTVSTTKRPRSESSNWNPVRITKINKSLCFGCKDFRSL